MTEVWVFEYDDGDFESSGARLVEWEFYPSADAAKAKAQEYADSPLEWTLVDSGVATWWQASRRGEEEFYVAKLQEAK